MTIAVPGESNKKGIVMGKREELRQGVAERIYKWYFRNSNLNDLGEWGKTNGATRGMVLAITDIVLEYENSQDVVIAKYEFYSDLMESFLKE